MHFYYNSDIRDSQEQNADFRDFGNLHKMEVDTLANVTNLFIRIKERKLTAKIVSNDTGISTGNLSDWKKGRCLPGATNLEILADYLDCSVDYLLGRTDVPEMNRK